MPRRLLMIGLDNATPSLIEPYLADGTMPNLAATMAAGLRTDTECPDGFIAESCWAQFAAGRERDELSYWSMMEFDPQTYTTYYGRVSPAPYFWARPDLVSIVFDVPETGLSDDIRGLHVCGWGSHAQGHPVSSRPHDLVGRIDRAFGVHPMVLCDSQNAFHNAEYLANLTDAMVEGIRLRTKISHWLMEQQPDWDLFLTAFGEPHVIGHQLLHGLTPEHPLYPHIDAEAIEGHVRRVMVELDAAFGELTAGFDDDQLLVFSTHGMRPNAVDTVGATLIPELLHRRFVGEPVLDFPDWSPGDPPIIPDARVLPRHWLETRLREPKPTTTSGLRGVRKQLSQRLRHALPATGLASLEKVAWGRPDWWEMQRREPAPLATTDVLAEASRREADQVVASSWYRKHWPSMPYFVVPSFSDCHIRLNLRGRERDGIVEPQDYDRVVQEITDELLSLIDARSGARVVDRVVRMRDDPMQAVGPPCDLVVVMADVLTDVIEHPDLGRLGPAPFQRLGEHIGTGWFVVVDGNGPAKNPEICEPRDLAATALDLLDVSPDPRVTGTSVLQAREPAATAD